MIVGQPSRTAYGAAVQRAAHQFLDDGRIFDDPLALKILGLGQEEIMREVEEAQPKRRLGFRLALAARSRFAENRLGFAVDDRGVRQYVVLGAGLDTFACRNPYAGALKVFEVDHPATQAWKRNRLQEAGIDIPDWLVFAPLDFERDALPDALARVGFDRSAGTLFSWLGVTAYLEREAVLATLRTIATLTPRSEVVFDFAEPPETFGPEQRAAYEERKARVASFGEPWVSNFEPASLRLHLREIGFAEILDLGPKQIAQRFYPAFAPNTPEHGTHFVHAIMA